MYEIGMNDDGSDMDMEFYDDDDACSWTLEKEKEFQEMTL